MEKRITQALLDDIRIRWFEECTPRVIKCLDMLSEEQLWYKPNACSNSVGTIITHLLGNIRQYVLHGLGGEEDLREREREFAVDLNVPKSDLKKELSNLMLATKDVLSQIEPQDLLSNQKVQCFQLNGMSILIHVTEHYSYHVGQIAYLTKMITNRQTGFYEGMDLAMTN